jgi:ArsR family transcriptional regulator
MTEVLKALADQNRYKIVGLLLKHDHCVRALSVKLGITEPAVSQHLKVLKSLNIVEGVKKGYFMHYQVNKSKIEEAIKLLNDLLK